MFTLKLTQDQVQLILSALVEHPYKIVAATVTDIAEQIRSQAPAAEQASMTSPSTTG